MTNEHDKLYKEARKRVKHKKKFYSHLISYFTIGLFLTFINWYTNPEHWWVKWVWIGWGIGIFFHGIGLFKQNIIFSDDWEERKIREEMEKMKR